MPASQYLPFLRQQKPNVPAVQEGRTPKSKKLLTKMMKTTALALGYNGLDVNRTNFECAPYDFDRIIQAIDTDSYVKQAFYKHQDLMWKEGWEIVGENPNAVDYIYQRFDFIEQAMQEPLQNFFMNISDQLFKFSNVFVLKIRAETLRLPYAPRLTGVDGQPPIVGYQILPTETIEIRRDKNNRPLEYRQIVDSDDSWGVYNYGYTNVSTPKPPSWSPDEIIHLTLDRKPGRIFGTPFMSSSMDDIVAIRQMEEDIQNLVHRELYPLYTYKVGTEAFPAEPQEIEDAANELAMLRTEGGLVLPERHEVEVIGAENTALDASKYLTHFKERVAVGLGLSPHHLGMMMNGGNRSVTDRLDIALYDRIKKHQTYLSECIRIFIMNELLLEAGFNPIVNPRLSGTSDRCVFRFNEIDTDTQIKKENHAINLYSSDITTDAEARLAVSRKPEPELGTFFMDKQHDRDADLLQVKTSAQAAKSASSSSSSTPKKSASVTSKPAVKRARNVVSPSNQHGRRISPGIRHDFDDILSLLEDE